MTTIHKYPIEVTDEQTIPIPRLATMLTVQMQGKTPCIWALVNTREEMEEQKVLVVGTGHPLPLGAISGTYVGTVQLSGGSLVYHVFVSR